MMSTLTATREATPRTHSPAGEVPTTQVNGSREVRETFFLSGPVPTAPNFPFMQEQPVNATAQQSTALAQPKAKSKRSTPLPRALPIAVTRPRLDVALPDALKSEVTLVGTEQADVEKKPVEIEEPANVTKSKVGLTDAGLVAGGMLLVGGTVATILGVISLCEGQKGLVQDQAGVKKFGPDTIAYEGTITWSQAVQMDEFSLSSGRTALYAAAGLFGGALLSLGIAAGHHMYRKRAKTSGSHV